MFLVRHVYGHGVFPATIRNLVNIRAIGIHDEYLRIRLRGGVVQRALVFESGNRTAEEHRIVVDPSGMAVVAGKCGEAFQIRSIRPDAENFEINVVHMTSEYDAISGW